FERIVATEVHDVYRRVRHLRDRNGSMNTFCLSSSWPGQCVVFGRGLSFGERALDEDVDNNTVLGVHTDETAGFTGCSHRFEDSAVVDEKYSRVGHEEFETRNALVDQRLELRQPLVRKVRHDHVEPIIDTRLSLGLGKPYVQRLI